MATMPRRVVRPGVWTKIRNELIRMEPGQWTNATKRWPEASDATIRTAVGWLSTSSWADDGSFGAFTNEDMDTIVYRKDPLP